MPTDDAIRRFLLGKYQRLLTPRDFKAVFDAASYKASHRCLLLLAIANDKNGTPRLGIVVSKKNARLAHQRNRIKRHLREQFRLRQHTLGGMDIVALAKPGLWQLDNAEMIMLIQQQWHRLEKQAAQRSGSNQEDTSCASA